MENKKWNFFTVGIILGLLFLALGIIAFYLVGGLSSDKPIYSYMTVIIAGLILLIGIVFSVMVVNGTIPKREPEYKTLFYMGLMWLAIGLAADMTTFWILGLVFIIAGAANKSKWKDQPKFSELPPAQRKLKLTLIVTAGLSLLLGIATWYLVVR